MIEVCGCGGDLGELLELDGAHDLEPRALAAVGVVLHRELGHLTIE